MQRVDFVVGLGVAFVIDWVLLVGRVVGSGQDWYWLRSDIAGEDIGTWDYKGLVENLAMRELQPQHEFFPPSSSRHSSRVCHTEIHRSNIIKFSLP